MALVGSPDALLAAAEQIADAARTLDAVEEDLVSHARSTTADWSGVAAPLALARITGDVETVRRTAEAVAGVVDPLRTYADELREAQRDFALGEQRSTQTAAPAQPENQLLREAAAQRALVANEAAARAFQAATDALAGAAPTAPQGAGSGLDASVAEAGNVAASLGNAALQHPASTLALAGGGALAALSVAGVLGGTAATATGVGSPLGVPLTGASLAGLTAGVGLAGAGAIDLTQHALGDDLVAPFQVNTDTGARGWPAGSAPDRIVSAGVPGRSRRVREVETEEELTELFDEFSAGGAPVPRTTYNGPRVLLPDGTEIGIRDESLSGGRTVDATLPNGETWKIHLPQQR
jgi:uncharacterized protein YukE